MSYTARPIHVGIVSHREFVVAFQNIPNFSENTSGDGATVKSSYRLVAGVDSNHRLRGYEPRELHLEALAGV